VLISAGLASALVAVLPMCGDFNIAHWGTEGPLSWCSAPTAGGTFCAELEDVDVRLALLVWDGGRWRPAPRIFNFGFNTAEVVSLNVEARLVNGTVHVTKGVFKPQLLAEEPPEPDIPPPGAFTNQQADGWLLLAAAVLLMFLGIYKAGSVLLDRLAGRR